MLIETGDVLEIDELGARKAGRVKRRPRSASTPASRTDVVEDIIVKRPPPSQRRRLS